MSIHCPNCGTENEEGVRFCQECGTPLEDEVIEVLPPEEVTDDRTILSGTPPTIDEEAETVSVSQEALTASQPGPEADFSSSEPESAPPPPEAEPAPPPPPPSPPAAGGGGSQRNIIIIVIVVLLLLCCCCATLAIVGAASQGVIEDIMYELDLSMLPAYLAFV